MHILDLYNDLMQCPHVHLEGQCIYIAQQVYMCKFGPHEMSILQPFHHLKPEASHAYWPVIKFKAYARACIGELPGLLARGSPFLQHAHVSTLLGSYPASYKSYRPTQGHFIAIYYSFCGPAQVYRYYGAESRPKWNCFLAALGHYKPMGIDSAWPPSAHDNWWEI